MLIETPAHAGLDSVAEKPRPIVIEPRSHWTHVIIKRTLRHASVFINNSSCEKLVVSVNRTTGNPLGIVHQCVVVKRVTVVKHHSVGTHQLGEDRGLSEWVSLVVPRSNGCLPSSGNGEDRNWCPPFGGTHPEALR